MMGFGFSALYQPVNQCCIVMKLRAKISDNSNLFGHSDWEAKFARHRPCGARESEI